MHTCKKCVAAIMDDKHPNALLPATLEDIERHYHIRGACAGCGSKVSIEIMKKQGIENWRRLAMTTAFFYPGCTHQIEASFIEDFVEIELYYKDGELVDMKMNGISFDLPAEIKRVHQVIIHETITMTEFKKRYGKFSIDKISSG